MSELENWCNEKGLSQQQKVEIKKHIKKDGGETVRDKKLFDFLSKKDSKELAKNSYVYISANLTNKMGSNSPKPPVKPVIKK